MTTTTPTPIAKGDEVLTPRGRERVAFVKFDQIGTGSFVVFCGSPSSCAPASVDVPALTWKKDGATYTANGYAAQVMKNGDRWQLVAGSMRDTFRKLDEAKAAAPYAVAVAAWHAAGNSWDLPTEETDPEEIKRREMAAAMEARNNEAAKLTEQRGARSARTIREQHSSDAVARSVRQAVAGSGVEVSHTRDDKHGNPGLVTVQPRRAAGFFDIVEMVRAAVPASMLAARSVGVDVFNGDIMTDYFSEVRVRIWPACAETVRAAVLAGELAPVLSGDSPKRYEWESVRDVLPVSWVQLADVMTDHENDPYNKAAAFAALVAQLERLPKSSRDSAAALLVALVSGWSSSWSDLFPAVLALVDSEELATEATPAAASVVEVVEAETVEAAEWPQALRDYLGRLLHAPKREHAEALAVALLSGAPLPQCSAKWAEDVAVKVRRHLRAVAA